MLDLPVADLGDLLGHQLLCGLHAVDLVPQVLVVGMIVHGLSVDIAEHLAVALPSGLTLFLPADDNDERGDRGQAGGQADDQQAEQVNGVVGVVDLGRGAQHFGRPIPGCLA